MKSWMACVLKWIVKPKLNSVTSHDPSIIITSDEESDSARTTEFEKNTVDSKIIAAIYENQCTSQLQIDFETCEAFLNIEKEKVARLNSRRALIAKESAWNELRLKRRLLEQKRTIFGLQVALDEEKKNVLRMEEYTNQLQEELRLKDQFHREILLQKKQLESSLTNEMAKTSDLTNKLITANEKCGMMQKKIQEWELEGLNMKEKYQKSIVADNQPIAAINSLANSSKSGNQDPSTATEIYYDQQDADRNTEVITSSVNSTQLHTITEQQEDAPTGSQEEHDPIRELENRNKMCRPHLRSSYLSFGYAQEFKRTENRKRKPLQDLKNVDYRTLNAMPKSTNETTTDAPDEKKARRMSNDFRKYRT